MRKVLFGALNKIPVTVMQGIASMLSKFRVTLLDGPCPKTDTKGTVWAPTIPENASPKDQIKYLTNVAHESAHMSEKTDIGAANAACNSKKLPFHIINAVDDIRIEALQEKKFRGLKKYYTQTYEIFLKEEGPKFEQTPQDYTEKLKQSLRYMILKLRCEQLDVPLTTQPSAEMQEFYDEIIADLEDDLKAQKTHDESIRLGMKIYKRVKDAVEKEEEQKQQEQQQQSDGADGGDGGGGDDKEDSDGSESSEDDGAEEDGGSSSSGDTEEKDGEDDKKGSGSKGKSGDEEPDKSLTPEHKKAAAEAASDALEEMEDEAEQLTTMQDDVGSDMPWPTEHDNGAYMVAPHVRDNIQLAWEGNEGEALKIKREGIKMLGSAGARMTKLFVTTHRPRQLYNRRDGSLDMRALVSDHMDTRKDVFTYKKPGAQDWAAVSFVLDQSGSMSGSKIQIATAIMSALLYYLDRVRIPCEAIGYEIPTLCSSSKWRDMPITINIFKRYDEPYRGPAMRRCIPDTRGNTPDLDALKYAVPRLWARPEKKKILMVLADGSPGVGNNKLNYKLMRDEKAYIKACKRAGIRVFGFGIHADLSRFYGDDFIYVDERTLGTAIVKKMTQVLNGKR